MPFRLIAIGLAVAMLGRGANARYGPATVDYESVLGQHDVIYLTPPENGYDGLILGDGEAGARIWQLPDRFMIQLNHSSFWNDSFPEPANDHGARIEIQT